MNAATLRGRLATLESAVRSLTREEIDRFGHELDQSGAAGQTWPLDRRFFFDGAADLKLSADEEAVVRELWTRMNAALVYAMTGREVDTWDDRRSFLARLDRIGSRSRQVEGRAATILERELGGRVWLGTIGIWNALSASLLHERLQPLLREDLTATWRAVGPSKAVLPEP